MPTGYTHAIKDGISFNTFALNCARAMGACVTIRDLPEGGENIPARFEPSNYHQKALEQKRLDLAALEKMSDADVTRGAEEDYLQAEASRLALIAEMNDLARKYNAMLEEVKAWEPPGPEHMGLQKFMVDQIEESIRFDCGYTHYEDPTPHPTPAEWLEQRKTMCLRDIKYHKVEHAKEVGRADDRTTWINLLRDSLPVAA